jgi:RNA polymerase sigma factor (sigma-70 family)
VSVTDLELIARVLAVRDGAAFAELMRRHQGDVRRLLRRLTGGNAALADDLAQETFLRAYRGLATYRGGRFGAWLYRIAYNVFASATRSGKLEPAHEHDPDALDTSIPAHDGLHLDIETALQQLRPEERIAIAVTIGRDITHEDAAELLGWPLGTLKSHVARGRDKLTRILRAWKDDR